MLLSSASMAMGSLCPGLGLAWALGPSSIGEGRVPVPSKAISEGQVFLNMEPKTTLELPVFLTKMQLEAEAVKKDGVHFWDAIKEDVLTQAGFDQVQVHDTQISLMAQKIQHDTQQSNDGLRKTFSRNFACMVPDARTTSEMLKAVAILDESPNDYALTFLKDVANELAEKDKGSVITSAFWAFPAGRKFATDFAVAVDSLQKKNQFVVIVQRSMLQLHTLVQQWVDNDSFDLLGPAADCVGSLGEEFVLLSSRRPARSNPHRPQLAPALPPATPGCPSFPRRGPGSRGPGIRTWGSGRARGPGPSC